MIQFLAINSFGKVRRETLNGRDYVIAPFTSIVPGVLSGSKGSLYYPPSEVANNPGVWNNIPITLGHPADPLTNMPESARQPHVLQRVQLGSIFNDHVTANGERAGDAWFDEQLTKDRAPNVYNLLLKALSGKKAPTISLSTGLYTENIPVENGTDPKTGRSFDAIATDYKPDHLAILENQRGACILPGQRVEGRFVNGSKARYTGEAVRLETASGEVLSVTPNHPVLTREGFVPAGQLTEGQDLLHYVGENVSRLPDGDEEDAPALAEDVFDSLACMLGVQRFRHTSPLDFHGDAEFFQGDVEIVRPERELVGGRKLGRPQGVQQGRLRGRGHFKRGLSNQGNSPLHFGGVAADREPLAVLLGGPGVHGSRSLGGAADQASFSQAAVDDAGWDAEPFADGVGTFSGDVGGDRCVDDFGGVASKRHSVLAPLCVVGPGAELDLSLSELAADRFDVGAVGRRQVLDGAAGLVGGDPEVHRGVGNDRLLEGPADDDAKFVKLAKDRLLAEVELFRQLPRAFPGKVLTDKLVHIDRFFHDGPVYDFGTTTGYIVAEKLIVSNCSVADGCGVALNEQGRDERGRFAGADGPADTGHDAHFDAEGNHHPGVHVGSGMGQYRTDARGQTFTPAHHALHDLEGLASSAAEQAKKNPAFHPEAEYQYRGLAGAYRNMSDAAGGGEAKAKEAEARADFHRRRGVTNAYDDLGDCTAECDGDFECINDCLDGVYNAEAAVDKPTLNQRFWRAALRALGFVGNASPPAAQGRHQESGQYLPTGGNVSDKQVAAAVKAGFSHLTGQETPKPDDPDGDGDSGEKAWSNRQDYTDGTNRAEAAESVRVIGNADQDRDDHGRFAAAGGGGGIDVSRLVRERTQKEQEATTKAAKGAEEKERQRRLVAKLLGNAGDGSPFPPIKTGKRAPTMSYPPVGVSNDDDDEEEVENDAASGASGAGEGADVGGIEGTGMSGSPMHVGSMAPTTGNANKTGAGARAGNDLPQTGDGAVEKKVSGAAPLSEDADDQGDAAGDVTGAPEQNCEGSRMATNFGDGQFPAKKKAGKQPPPQEGQAVPAPGGETTAPPQPQAGATQAQTGATQGGIPAPAPRAIPPEPVGNREGTMQLTQKERSTAVGYLTVNCDCWKGKAQLLGNKDLVDDDTLVKLVKNTRSAKANQLVVNAAAQAGLTFNAKAEGSNADASESQGVSVEADGDSDGGGGYKTDATPGIDGDVDDSVKGSVNVGDRLYKGKVPGETNNADVEAWLKKTGAPAAVYNAIFPEKERIIGVLVRNVRDPRTKARLVANHRRKTMDQLRDEVSQLPNYLQPAVNATFVEPPAQPVYGGRPDVSFVDRSERTDNGGEDADVLPTLNLFSGLAAEREANEDAAAGRRARA